MKTKFVLSLLLLAGCAWPSHAQVQTPDKPGITIGTIQTVWSQQIGGARIPLKKLIASSLPVLGTWTWQDGKRIWGYIYTDDAALKKENANGWLIYIGDRSFEVGETIRWESGETAIEIPDLDAKSAAILRVANWRAPLINQIEANWQVFPGARVKLSLLNRSDKTLSLSLGELKDAGRDKLMGFTATRAGKPVKMTPASTTVKFFPSFLSLKPGETWTREFDLNLYGDFSAPGHYKIDGIYKVWWATGSIKQIEFSELPFEASFELDVR